MAEKPYHLQPIHLNAGEKIYFASDFHLGAPNLSTSQAREQKIIQWLEFIEEDAKAIFLVGDIFDFWFEYKHTVPKGFVRFLGKIAELRDREIPIYFFTGNHDMWMFDYFPKELDIPVFKGPLVLEVNSKKLFVAHGDGLGKGDNLYKFYKRIFSNRFFQWLFNWVHPNIGMSIAHYWSRKSRVTSEQRTDVFKEEEERLFQYCKSIESQMHHDYYIFGHRHLPITMNVSEIAVYYNLGEWFNHFSYIEMDENEARLTDFTR